MNMLALKLFIIKHWVLLLVLVAILAALVVGLVLVLARSNNQLVQEAQQQTNFAVELENPDPTNLLSLFGDELSYISLDKCCTVQNDRAKAISVLLSFLTDTEGGFSIGTVEDIDVSEFSLPDSVDLSEYKILIHADGKSWIAYRNNDQGKISMLIMRLGDTSVSLNEEQTPTPVLVDSSENPQPEKYLGIRYMETAGSHGYREVEVGDTALLILIIENAGLTGNVCKFNAYRQVGAIQEGIESRDFPLLATDTVQTISLPSGSYAFTVDCVSGAKTYTVNATADIIVTPGSACDSKDFDFTAAAKTFTEVRSGVVGKWRGCTLNPWTKPYEVEFIFYANGNYESRNIEVLAQPDTLRTQVALYYGSDDNNPKKTFELKNQLTNGDVEGDIYIYFGEFSTNIDAIKTVRLNADSSKLYFEMMHSGSYGPLKYELERVE